MIAAIVSFGILDAVLLLLFLWLLRRADRDYDRAYQAGRDAADNWWMKMEREEKLEREKMWREEIG